MTVAILYVKSCRSRNTSDLFDVKWLYDCLKPASRDHVAKSCKNPRICGTCKGQHPTSLHKEEVRQPTKEEVPVTSAIINSSNAMGLKIVEIYLEHQNDPAKKIKTLAFLDMGFHGTFVAEDILDNLGVRCANIHLEVQTLNGKSLQPCRSITGLKISPNDKNRTSISLPKTADQLFQWTRRVYQLLLN